MHLYLQLTRSLAVTLIWLYCNKLVLRYVRLCVSDLGQVSIPQPGIVKVNNSTGVKIWTLSTFGLCIIVKLNSTSTQEITVQKLPTEPYRKMNICTVKMSK